MIPSSGTDSHQIIITPTISNPVMHEIHAAMNHTSLIMGTWYLKHVWAGHDIMCRMYANICAVSQGHTSHTGTHGLMYAARLSSSR